MKKLYRIILQNEAFSYLFFGVLTTIVNFGTFVIADYLLGSQYYLISNILSFVVATLFAFLTNKQFVFKSKGWRVDVVLKELGGFVSSRISTFLVVEEFGLWLSVKLFDLQKIDYLSMKGTFIAKIVLAFVAVVLNYVLSKFLVFKKKSDIEE